MAKRKPRQPRRPSRTADTAIDAKEAGRLRGIMVDERMGEILQTYVAASEKHADEDCIILVLDPTSDTQASAAPPEFRYQVNDISVHRFQDGPRTCYVSNTGALACLK